MTIWYLEDGFETVVPSDKRARYTGREPNRQLIQPVAPKLRRRGRARPGEPDEGRGRARLLPARGRARSSTSSSWTRSASAAGSPACSGPTARRSRRTTRQGALRVGRCRNGRLRALPVRGDRAADGRAHDDDRRLAVATPRPRRPARRPAAGPSASILAVVLRAVVFDVDFTLARPGPGPRPGRLPARSGSATGSTSTPAATSKRASTAFAEVKHHPELDHDEEIWVLFTERSSSAWAAPATRTRAAVEMERRWTHSAHFELYDDALPVLDALRDRGLKIGLLSELVARPGRVRRASRHLGRRGADVARARQDQAAPHDLPRHARPAGGRAGRRGDGRRHDRGRHRGRDRGRHAGGAARPRRAVSGVRRAGSTTCASFPRLSDFSEE